MSLFGSIADVLADFGDVLGFGKNRDRGAGVTSEQRRLLDDENKRRQDTLKAWQNWQSISDTISLPTDDKQKFGR